MMLYWGYLARIYIIYHALILPFSLLLHSYFNDDIFHGSWKYFLLNLKDMQTACKMHVAFSEYHLNVVMA